MNAAQYILTAAIRFYRYALVPAKIGIFGPVGRCRFSPSCSAYALEAVRVHGVCRGTALAAWRICRCHPWGQVGPDPVPPPKKGYASSGIEARRPSSNTCPGAEPATTGHSSLATRGF